MNTDVANSGGPGSSITLDPEIVSLRNRYLKALEGKPFDEMNLLIQKQLETEGEDIKRLSLLAARVYILRLRTLELRNEPTENAMPWSKEIEEKNNKNKPAEGTEVKGVENKNSEWRRLRMIEAGEVNGVRFPPGIIIDVNSFDGEKLVESNKAEYVDINKSDENSETEENDTVNGDKISSDSTQEKTTTKAKEEDNQVAATENTEEEDIQEENNEGNLADELKELSETMSTEADGKK